MRNWTVSTKSGIEREFMQGKDCKSLALTAMDSQRFCSYITTLLKKKAIHLNEKEK